jgi:RNA polymerase sigma factor (TIGR02999 family)
MSPPEASTVVKREVQLFAEAVVRRATLNEFQSLDQMLPLVYEEFRGLASYLMRQERGSHTLGPTALAHEAYLRLVHQSPTTLQDGAHLLSVAAMTMRRVLIDHARAHGAVKRGGDQQRVTLGDDLFAEGSEFDLLDLQRVLEKLEAIEPRKVRAVELLYFGGLTFEEAGQALAVSTRTVVRDWKFAKAWLWRELSEAESSGS